MKNGRSPGEGGSVPLLWNPGYYFTKGTLMRISYRWAPAMLAMAIVLPGCSGGGEQGKLDPNMPSATVEVKGMT